MLIDEPLKHHARARGSHPALVSGEREVTYAELDALVDRAAAGLAESGVRAGHPVAVALRDGIEYVVVMFALARLGAPMLPVDWRWTRQEQEHVLDHFQPKLLLADPSHEPISMPRVVVEEGWSAGLAPAGDVPVFPTCDGPLLFSLSSGTTGRPKGPQLSHSQMLARFKVHWINFGFNSQDRYVCATPMYYGGGRAFVMSTIHAGGTVVMFCPPYTPEALCAEVERTRATATFLVPTLLRRLLTLDDETLAPMRGMRMVLSSGGALHPSERHVMRTRVCPGFVQYYASTEGGGITFLTTEDGTEYDDSVGRPVFEVDVQCVDRQDVPVRSGEIGRIRYRGPAVATGFYNDPEASKAAFRDGWYYPGDLGYFDDGGFLYLKGRDKDVIIRGGINIYPADIEDVLLSHPAVSDVAVVGAPSVEFNEEVVAFVVLSGEATSTELTTYASERLARYKWPHDVVIVDDLPRNPSGKVVKSVLVEQLAAQDS